jgi:hypothetical protein
MRAEDISVVAILLLLGGCATVPMEQAGTLSSYGALAPSNGFLTHARLAVDKAAVLGASTAKIIPTDFAGPAANVALSPRQREILTNVVDRSLCIGLSDRFHIVAYDQPADMNVHAAITYVGLTDEEAAALSKAAFIGATVAEKVYLPAPLPPLPKLRIPIGMGGLAVEAEALDPSGRQLAAIIWARGADAFTSDPKVSVDGDAYDLGKAFAADFSRLLVTGRSPFNKPPSLPSVNRINAALGGAPKEAACRAFGRGPGMAGVLGDVIGLPPEWTDKGAPAMTPPEK